MAAFLDNCRFIPTTGGTTDWVYSSAVGGCQSPAAAGAADGRKYKFLAISTDLTQWELAEGAYNSSAGTFARTTVLYNSAGTGVATGQSGAGSKISFTVAPNVAIVGLKEDLLSVEEANSFTATQKAQGRANLDVLRKNYLVNGAMMISQENAGNGLTANDVYPADQWRVLLSYTATVTAQQAASATPGGSTSRLRFTVSATDTSITGSEYYQILQPIEGQRMADLRFGTANAKSVTIQFGCKGPAGTYAVGLRNAAANRAYIAEFSIGAGEANADVVKSVTIPGDTSGTWASDNTNGMFVTWCLAVGPTFQTAAGSWVAGNFLGTSNVSNFVGANGNVFELFDVGLYEGSAAPAFQVPDLQSELALCQRYYEKSYNLSVTPGTASSGPGLNAICISSNSIVNAQSMGSRPFQVRKRAAPTMTIYGYQGGSGKVSDATPTDLAAGSGATSIVGEYGFNLTNGAGSTITTTNTVVTFHWTANARL